ncbi:hypothetical protein QYF61_007211 [Mycteria americana]|uniref:Uncharacterized protein n=1 Tax=Mycteria americana TaxID=33587 RepID=A0AAN7RXM1_MYCAM|nr:hypothetical protein QYF61_007211 [Mycteria americana]
MRATPCPEIPVFPLQFQKVTKCNKFSPPTLPHPSSEKPGGFLLAAMSQEAVFSKAEAEEVLQPSGHFHVPPLDPLRQLHVLLVLRAPELDAVLQVRPHQSKVERQNHLPRPAGHASVDAAQDSVGLLGCERTLLAHVQLFVHQYPQGLFRRAALDYIIPQPVLKLRIALTQEFGFSQQTSGLSVIKPQQKSSLPFRLSGKMDIDETKSRPRWKKRRQSWSPSKIAQPLLSWFLSLREVWIRADYIVQLGMKENGIHKDKGNHQSNRLQLKCQQKTKVDQTNVNPSPCPDGVHQHLCMNSRDAQSSFFQQKPKNSQRDDPLYSLIRYKPQITSDPTTAPENEVTKPKRYKRQSARPFACDGTLSRLLFHVGGDEAATPSPRAIKRDFRALGRLSFKLDLKGEGDNIRLAREKLRDDVPRLEGADVSEGTQPVSLRCAGYTGAQLKLCRVELGDTELIGAKRETPVKYLKAHKGCSSMKETWTTAQLKCLYTNAHSMGNKQEELEAIVHQENYDIVAITETWWDDSGRRD